MLSSRGLQPAHFAPSACRTSSIRSHASRQFSSAPRKSVLLRSSCQSNSLLLAKRRIGASSPKLAAFNASTVRNASWYAPWTWIPAPADAPKPTSTPSEFAPESTHMTEAPVTTQTPELSPGTLDHPPVLESSAAAQTHTFTPDGVEELIDSVMLAGGPPESVAAATSTAASGMGEKIGFLKNDLGLDYGWGPSAFYEWMIEHLHIWGGLEWGSAIIVSSVVIRALCFKFSVSASHNMAKVQAVSPLTAPLQKEMSEAMKAQDTAKVQSLRARSSAIYKQAGASPFRGLIPMAAQGIIGFGAFRCLRGMSSLPVESMQHQGFLWFQDLTVADPYYLIPAIIGGSSYIFFKYGGEAGVQNSDPMGQSVRKGMMLFFPLLMTTVSVWMPASLQIYFFCSTTLGIGQARLLRIPSVRQALGIAPIPTPESQKLWTQVINGEKTVDEIKAQSGKFTYQPAKTQTINVKARPASKTSSKPTRPTYRGLTLKAGASLPSHMAAPKAEKTKYGDVDFDEGMPKHGSLSEKASWMFRNNKPNMVLRRMVRYLQMRGMGDDIGSTWAQKKADEKKVVEREREIRRKEGRG